MIAPSALLVATALAAGGPDITAMTSRMGGVAWVAGGQLAGPELERVRALGASWIAQTPFAFMRDPSRPELRYHPHNEWYWGESDEGLAETRRRARNAGLKALLKPHVWLHRAWPGDIAMASEEDWRRWFVAYSDYLLHHARLAECEGFDMLAVGTELKQVSRAREADFRALIARVREVYHGPLVYAANWDEVFEVPFWDALDYIGVNAYFPLSSPAAVAWDPIRARLAELAARSGRQIVVTELGYPAVGDCTARPWEDGENAGAALGLECQRGALDAAFAALWPEPWLAGVFAWKWFPDPERADDGRSFDLNGRPAAAVLESWFRRGSAPGPVPGAHGSGLPLAPSSR